MGVVGNFRARRRVFPTLKVDQQPWSSGRTPRCGWEVLGSRPGRSRTLNCTHWVTWDPTPIKRVLADEGGVYVTKCTPDCGVSHMFQLAPTWHTNECHLIDVPPLLEEEEERTEL